MPHRHATPRSSALRLAADGHPGYGDLFADLVYAILDAYYEGDPRHLFPAIDRASDAWFAVGAHHVNGGGR